MTRAVGTPSPDVAEALLPIAARRVSPPTAKSILGLARQCAGITTPRLDRGQLGEVLGVIESNLSSTSRIGSFHEVHYRGAPPPGFRGTAPLKFRGSVPLPLSTHGLDVLRATSGDEELVHVLDTVSTSFTSFFRKPDHFVPDRSSRSTYA